MKREGSLLELLVQLDLLERAARGRLAAARLRVRRELGFDLAADVLDARVAGQRDRPLAHQLGAGVGLGVVRGGAHQPAVQLARADQEVQHLAAHLARVDHVRARRQQPLAVARRELRRAQAHVAPEPHAQPRDRLARERAEHVREGPPDPLGEVAVDLLAVQPADVVRLEDVGGGRPPCRLAS